MKTKYKTKCKHCGATRQLLGLGLCYKCYGDARIRTQYKPANKTADPENLTTAISSVGSVLDNINNTMKDAAGLVDLIANKMSAMLDNAKKIRLSYIKLQTAAKAMKDVNESFDEKNDEEI